MLPWSALALTATVYSFDIELAHVDRGVYESLAFRVAQHPSETDERVMIRLLAFALFADERLEFGRGLSTDDEPDLWQRDLTGRIRLWIDVGLPDEKLVRRACGRSDEVVIYGYGRSTELWWERSRAALGRARNLRVLSVPAAASQALAKLAQRSMQLQCTIQEGHAWLSDKDGAVEVALATVASPPVASR